MGQDGRVSHRAVVAFAGVLMMTAGCDTEDGTAAASTSTVPATITSTTPSTTTPPPTTASPTPTTTSVPAPMALTRPYVDPSVCEPVAAIEGTFDDLKLTPFWIWTEEPIAIQVLGDPALGPIGPFAVLLRYPEQIAEMSGRDIETVNDWRVAIVASPNGNGDALWQLPDGSEAYLRTRDLDRTQIVAVIEQLQPRAADAPIPGLTSVAAPGRRARSSCSPNT